MNQATSEESDSQCHGPGVYLAFSLCLVAATIRTLGKESKFSEQKKEE